MKFEENWRMGLRGEVVKSVDGRTTNRERTATDDGRQVITIAHPEPSAQVSLKV